ncbi:hypothetical protein SDC9_160917 [bioreactor metagenome]|uniref:NADPH-dependent FMN reductase-like domain-containing protein n=1 Tax=bioreactor metagenome TaxID=1076179 RepID=A0A645FGR0_9ZZZZ|nr:flavodoxin family protein [Candidatus Pelethousia sp.]
MKLVLHDLPHGVPENMVNDGDRIVSATGPKAPCVGCFGCWLKTPSSCVLRDRIGDMANYLAECEELLIISKTYIGGLAPDTKNLLDRSIGYLLPFMRTLKLPDENGKLRKEQHHALRYKKSFRITLVAYGKEAFEEEEKKSIIAYIRAVSINFNGQEPAVHFVKEPEELLL